MSVGWRCTTAMPHAAPIFCRSAAGKCPTGFRRTVAIHPWSTPTNASLGSTTPRRSTGPRARASPCSTRASWANSWCKGATEQVLNRVSANSVSIAVGRNIYTQWLNHQGGIIADLTVTQLGEQEYLLVTGDVLQRVTTSWMRRNTLPGEHCSVADMTSAYTLLSLQGPRSRELLQAITGSDLSTERVPFRASCEVDIGFARVLLVHSPTWAS